MEAAASRFVWWIGWGQCMMRVCLKWRLVGSSAIIVHNGPRLVPQRTKVRSNHTALASCTKYCVYGRKFRPSHVACGQRDQE